MYSCKNLHGIKSKPFRSTKVEDLYTAFSKLFYGQFHNKKLLKVTQLTGAYPRVELVLICLCCRGEGYSRAYNSGIEIRTLLCNNMIKIEG